MRDPSLGTRLEWFGIAQVPTRSMASYNRPVNVSSYILPTIPILLPNPVCRHLFLLLTRQNSVLDSDTGQPKAIDRRRLTAVSIRTCDVISKTELFIFINWPLLV